MRNIKFLQRVVHNNIPYMLFSTAKAVFTVLIYLCGILMPRNFLRELIAENLEQACIWVLFLLLSETLGVLILSYIESKERLVQKKLDCKLNDKLIRTSFEFQYQDYENYEFRERYHLSQKCVTSSHISGAIMRIFTIATSFVTIIPLLWIISTITWWLWLLMIGSIILNGICELIRNRYVRAMFSETNQNDCHMLYARDVLTSRKFATEVRLFHLFNYVSHSLRQYIDDLASLQKKQASRTFRLYLISYTYNLIQTVALFIYVLYRCVHGFIPIPDFMIVCLAIMGISELSVAIAKNVIQVREDFFYIDKYRSMVDDLPNRNKINDLSERDQNPVLHFQNVSFTYSGTEKPAVNNLSVDIPCGKIYGIVGKNGSGKSTFVNLLMKLYSPDSGKILFGDKDLSKVSFDTWKNKISAVLQDFHVYSFTVRDNITFGANENIDYLLNLFDIPYKADQPIGAEYEDDGITLSGGEEQKLAMLRAIRKDAEFYIFDEPTSALSAASEKKMYEIIRSQFKGKTVFFISHRLASCMMCDDIIVFDDGRIIERGTHQELMSRKKQYYQMFNAQSKLYLTEDLKG